MAARTKKRTPAKRRKAAVTVRVVKVKPHCRHPPQRAWQKAAKSAADWGW